MLISFVIPAYNEAQYIGATIDAIGAACAEAGVEHEVVVADDSSDDGTGDIARSRGARVVVVSNRQIAATRNAGGRAATGDVLVWVDADTRVSAGAVRGAVDAIGRGHAGGGARITFDEPRPWFVPVGERVMMGLYRVMRLASGAFIFCRREVFEQTGGFDESLYIAEEAIMSRSIGGWAKERRRGGDASVRGFAFVNDSVVTSSRKFRTFSFFTMFWELFKLLIGGQRYARKAGSAGLWYGERRDDPKAAGGGATP